MTRHREVEKKFDVDPELELGPVVAALPADRRTRDLVAAVADPVTTELVATYVDTPDLSLSRRGATLRRRTGGSDAGWHLKLRTAADEKLEIRRPLGRSVKAVPAALLDEVRPWVRDRTVAPVAVLTTSRVEHQLLAADGTVLAVLADDTVDATRTGQDDVSDPLVWRELEVELVTGDRDLLAAVGTALRKYGIAPSGSTSKLGRVLGDPQPVPLPDTRLPPRAAGRALRDHLVALVADLHAQDRLARAGDVDGVHDMRVTARRLRSALAIYRPLVDRRTTDPLRDELHWLGARLGVLRDTHVVDERLSAVLSHQPPGLVVGPVRRRLAQEMRAREKAEATSLRAALSDERYYRLLDALDDLLMNPPFTRAAGRPARKTLTRLVRRTVRRVRRRAALLDPAVAPVQRDALLHELRKAARRCRYAAESAEAVLGDDAARLGARMHDLQDVLGEHQDSVTATATLRALAEAAESSGESSVTYGVLLAAEDARGREARTLHSSLLKKALNRKATGWLE